MKYSLRNIHDNDIIKRNDEHLDVFINLTKTMSTWILNNEVIVKG